jgi:hypothetical protein
VHLSAASRLQVTPDVLFTSLPWDSKRTLHGEAAASLPGVVCPTMCGFPIAGLQIVAPSSWETQKRALPGCLNLRGRCFVGELRRPSSVVAEVGVR